MSPAWMRTRPLALLLLACAGCVTVESTLRSDGSATLEMRYRATPDVTEFQEKRRYSSADVHVESVKIEEDQRTTLRATIDDATRLSTATGFAFVRVERTHGTDERLDIRLLNPKPTPVAVEHVPWLRIGLLLPGPVEAANREAVVSGSHVTWTLSRSDYQRSAETVLTVRWRPAPPG